MEEDSMEMNEDMQKNEIIPKNAKEESGTYAQQSEKVAGDRMLVGLYLHLFLL